MNSGKVYVIVGGKLAKVPEEYAKKVVRKEQLVARAVELNRIIEAQGVEVQDRITASTAVAERSDIIAKIVRLNRQIPPCVQFVEAV